MSTTDCRPRADCFTSNGSFCGAIHGVIVLSCGIAEDRGGAGGGDDGGAGVARGGSTSNVVAATSKGSLQRAHVTRFPANSGRYLYVAPHEGHVMSVLMSLRRVSRCTPTVSSVSDAAGRIESAPVASTGRGSVRRAGQGVYPFTRPGWHPRKVLAGILKRI